jgi:hypothetical protein
MIDQAEEKPTQPELHDLCITAVEQMIDLGITKHESWIVQEETSRRLPDRKLAKVTIEFVNENDNKPENLSSRELKAESKPRRL